MTPEKADELAEIARQTATSLVARVHTDSAEAIWAHLGALSTEHLFATTVVLAAMVPLAADPDELLAWLEDEPSATVLHTHTHQPTDTGNEPMDLNIEAKAEAPADEVREAARRKVAAHATDAGEAAMFLAMLGLDEEVAA
ncbi:hypothetical protein AB0H58_31500 [Nocardia neocaledoniensis]|uniref:hypothetical protein n=1 Tax=Nocardia neocaledoniensis TaxID=236511 RepID=UPI002453D94E|nr:hypothetical protein [Nocardia neocaledoniensis]